MATKVVVRITCDKCNNDIIDETEHVSLRIIREDAPMAPLELDLHEGCVDSLYLPDEVIVRKRTRRTRAQMEADAAAEAEVPNKMSESA